VAGEWTATTFKNGQWIASNMLHRDRRGLALALASFVALIVICGLLYVLFNPAISNLTTMPTDQASSQTAVNEIEQASTFWGLVLFPILFIGLLFLIGRAIFESGVR
jgi:hypothetical protein